MKLSLIIPVYNEEDTIDIFYQAVTSSNLLSQNMIEYIFVNDGSQDQSLEILERLAAENTNVIVVNFSRNFGKESALVAGLSYATGDASIPIDVDLQDPIEVIPEMISKWQEGYEVVLAKRSDRKDDSFLKRATSTWFYRLHNSISSPRIEENVGDFRLISKEVVTAILSLPEKQLFMKGVLSWVGFKTAIIEYSRPARVAGKTKFSGWKLWNFAIDGITSFSTWPLRIWTYIGFFVALLAFFYASWMIISKLLWGNPVPGYPSLMTAILFLGGVQLIGIGVLGEYIGRIYLETKQRPRYIVKSTLNTSEPMSNSREQ
ncbi:glycosyltransferase family 2 protein [Halomonas sp. QX-2]|uniref:Glycosyltransferase family 2 protein n=1 Tax=Vreelandella sedimenti TaxID=2729618 RepID=A0A7Z0N9Y5_9GAMM|nr:glycosyltransferase family 2 protein [Halomonas sedimenti]NYT74327.1 glycosyltransferase family 2 protein [Halomonas sedimenti]